MNNGRYNIRTLALELLMVALALMFFIPLYMTFINGFTTYNEVVTSVLALPEVFQFENFITVWKQLNFFGVFMNSITLQSCP